MAEGKHLQLKRGNAADIPTLLAGELGFAVDTGALYSSKAGAGNIIIGGEGVLRDIAAGITLANADLTLKGAPSTDNMAATKAYVDAARMGIDVKGSVRYATTEAGTLATSFANGQTIDGKTLSTGDRILIKNQASGTENGIYVVKASGAPDRATDFPAAASVAGAFMFIEDGSTLADTGWICTNNQGTDIVGTDALVFSQFNAGTAVSASLGVEKVGNDFRLDILANAGLALTGNEIGVKLDGTTLSVGAGGLKLKAASAQYKFLMSGSTPFDYAETDVSALAGAGLACTNGVLAVGEGTLIDVGADAVGIHPAAADYSFIKAVTTPWTPVWGLIADLAGSGLGASAGALTWTVQDMDFGAFV